MDDYLSKPLRLHELGDMLRKWLPKSQAVCTSDALEVVTATPPASLATWNASTLAQMMGNNPDMHVRFLTKFLIMAKNQVTAILAAVAENDNATVAELAHSLKSAARTIGALALGKLCEEMETAACDGVDHVSRALSAGLNASLSAAEEAITRHLAQQ